MRLNNFETTLTANCTSTDVTISIADTTNLDVGDYLTFVDNNEIVKITSVGANSLDVDRGVGGTTATSHSSGTVLQMRVTAQHLDDIDNKIINHEGRTDNPHNVTASQVGAISQVLQDPSPTLGGDLYSNGHIVVDSDDAINDNVVNKLIVHHKLTFLSFDSYEHIPYSVNGSGSCGQQLGLSYVKTGTTANSEARENLDSNAMSLASGYYILMYVYLGYLTGDTVGFAGVSSTLLSGQTNHTLTVKHAGLFYDNGIFYTSTADGTNQELQQVSPSTSGYLKMYYNGSTVYFYLDDTLLSTHTTYTYTGEYPQIYVNDKGNGIDTKIYWYNLIRR